MAFLLLDEINVDEAFAGLTPARLPAWGKMTARQMPEHLSFILKVSHAGYEVPVSTLPVKLEKVKKLFLFSDAPFKQNVQSPLIDNLPDPEFAEITLAIEDLKKQIISFQAYYLQNPNAIHNHPIFGPLNYEEWNVFHGKHFMHHMKQFGLV